MTFEVQIAVEIYTEMQSSESIRSQLGLFLVLACPSGDENNQNISKVLTNQGHWLKKKANKKFSQHPFPRKNSSPTACIRTSLPSLC